MNKNDIQNLIADFYRVCLFGTKDPDIEDAAKRAYIDLCRTIWDTTEDIRAKAKEESLNFISSQIEGLKNDNIDFDEFHDTLCCGIIEIYNNNHIDFYYGQAQKWVNMTMKYLCVIGEEKYPWLKGIYEYLHIPIDSIILDRVINELKIESVIVNNNKVSLKNLRWSRIKEQDTYKAIQSKLRVALNEKGEIPIVWEFKAWNNPKENK